MKKTLLFLFSLLFSFAFGQEEWRTMNTDNSDIPSNKTISLGITTDDQIFIGTPGGLVDPSHVYEYDQENWTETDWISSFNAMKSSPQGHLVVATGEGLYHYNGTEVVVFNKDNSNLTSNNISCMDIGADGSEYIGMTAAGLVATGGLGIYNGSYWSVYNDGNSILPVDNVGSVFISNSDVLWIGSLNAGLVKKDGDNWELFDTDNSDIPGNNIICMAESMNGVLWLAFNNGSIATTTNGTDWTIVKEESAKDFPNSNVSDMLFDAKDKLWVSFEEGGIAGFDGSNWVFHTSLLSPLPSDHVTNMVLDSEEYIWISTQDEGLAIFDPDFGAGVEDIFKNKVIEIYPNPVSSLLNIEIKDLNTKTQVFVYNLMGQIIIQKEINNTNYQLDCSELATGFYTLKLKHPNGNQQYSKAFIKK